MGVLNKKVDGFSMRRAFLALFFLGLVFGVLKFSERADAAKPEYFISITNSSVNAHQILSLTGLASSTNFAGQLSQHNVQVRWGDGLVSNTSPLSLIGSGSNFSGSWSNSHQYNSAGTYGVTAKIYHGNPPGAEASGDAVVTITVVIPPQCSDALDNDGDGEVDSNDDGCSDPDDNGENLPPVITLLGDNPLIVSQSSIFTDPGATALDSEDGDLTSGILASGAVNTGVLGDYIRTYMVLDSQEVWASAQRTVRVVVQAVENTLLLCSDTIDNDNDSRVDLDDPDCSTFIPKLTVVKHVINDNGGVKLASDFTISVIGSDANPSSFPGSEVGTVITLDPGSYSVDEVDAQGYSKSLSADCSGSIGIGDSRTCTITNDDVAVVEPGEENTLEFCTDGEDNDDDELVDLNDPDCSSFLPRLTVIKEVINDNGGVKLASDFTLMVTGTGVSTPSFAGSGAGTLVTLLPGIYSVDEEDSFGYLKTSGENCSGTIAVGESKTCTIVNNDPVAETVEENNLERCTDSQDNDGDELTDLNDPDCSAFMPKLNVTVGMTNNDGGVKLPSDAGVTVTGTDVSNPSFPGNTSPTEVTLAPGSYAVSGSLTGYTVGVSSECSGTIAAGETKSCQLTFDDVAVTPPGDDDTGGGGDGGNGGGGGENPTVILTGGGGGGGSAPSGEVLGVNTGTPIGQVLGDSTTCGVHLGSFIRRGANNDILQVVKLQEFLNNFEGESLPLTGFYGSLTEGAVRRFQVKNAKDVLLPWVPFGHDGTSSTGYVYKTTRRALNNLACPALNLPIPLLP
ncbi:MAG: hypothetical protein G01um101420_132 [Parcubacteria group bacterium Gr01-1014_20]|nr:MAG: hypothetical protein G01um101420_132 [Parcubacteria group bacterium Gr01-1014_20]